MPTSTRSQKVKAAAPRPRARKPVQPPAVPASGLWLQRFVDPDLRLSTDERLSESTVYAAIRQIVDPLAAAPWNVVVRDGGRRTTLGDGNLSYLLNTRPNPDQPASAVKEALATSAIVYGAGYWAINRDDSGRAIELWPLEYPRVQMVRDAETSLLYYRYTQPDSSETYLRGPDVVHARGPTVAGLNGDSLVDRASPAVSLAVAQARFASAFFQNAGVLSGYLKFPGAVTDPNEIERLKKDWGGKYAGRKAHGVGVVEGGGEFVPISVDATKAQLKESREMSVQDVARYFGVPLVLLSLAISAQGYGTNTTQFFEMFVRTCLGSWKRRLEEEATYKLCPQRAPWPEVQIDLGFLTRGNAAERAATNEILIRSGQLTPNEARAEEGRDSMDGGDVLLLNGKPLEDIIDPPTPPPPPAVPEPVGDEAPDDEEAPAIASLLRDGIALALGNHRRRWLARTKDVAEEHHPAAREELRGKFAADLGALGKHITDEQFAALATQVEAGVEPAKAVEHVLGGTA